MELVGTAWFTGPAIGIIFWLWRLLSKESAKR